MLIQDFFIRQNRGLVFVLFATLFLNTAHSQNSDSKKESQETLTLTISDAVNIALENNVAIKRSEIQLDAARRAKKSSWNSASPTLSVGGAFSKNNDNFSENYSAYLQGKISVSLSTNLYSDIRAAKLKYEAGEISYEAATRAVELNVRTAFYNLLYQKENVALQQQNLDTSRAQYQMNQRKYSQGALSQIDVLTSQVNYEANIPLLQNAQITLENDEALFKKMLGLEQDVQISLQGDLDEIVELFKDEANDAFTIFAQYLLQDAEKNNAEISALEKNIEIAKNEILAKRFSAYGPSLNAAWTFQPTWAKTAAAGTSGPDERGALSLSVTIPLDGVLPWSKSANLISDAKDSLEDYELQIQDKKTEIQVSAQSSIRKIEQLLATMRTLQSSAALAERSYQMTAEAYDRGSRNFTELLSARNSLEQARLNLKQQAFSLAQEILNLENTLGVPFGTLLNFNMNSYYMEKIDEIAKG